MFIATSHALEDPFCGARFWLHNVCTRFYTMHTRFLLLTLFTFTWLGSTLPLAARDSIHLVCVGRVNLGDPDAKDGTKFVLTYDDQRGGEGGDKRQVWVAMSLSSGNRVGVGKDLMDGDTAKVTLHNQEDKNDVLFRGTVQLVDGAEHALVVGDFISDDKKVHHLHVKLECYEVPGIWYGQNLERGK